jgi:hypothetical protein
MVTDANDAHPASPTARAEAFAFDCSTSAAPATAQRLIEAHALLIQLVGPFERAPDRSAIERLVAVEAFESAALALAGPDRAFMFSRGCHAMCLATVVSVGGEEITADGATPTLALLSALAGAWSVECRERSRLKERFFLKGAERDPDRDRSRAQ